MGGGGSKTIIYNNDKNIYQVPDQDNTPNISGLTTAHEGFQIFFRNKHENDDIVQLITILLFLLLFFMLKYI